MRPVGQAGPRAELSTRSSPDLKISRDGGRPEASVDHPPRHSRKSEPSTSVLRLSLCEIVSIRRIAYCIGEPLVHTHSPYNRHHLFTSATVDLEHDRASRAAGEKIRCPLLALWGAKGLVHKWYDVLGIWRGYAAGEVAGAAVNSGHYLPEEAPGEVLAHLDRFL